MLAVVVPALSILCIVLWEMAWLLIAGSGQAQVPEYLDTVVLVEAGLNAVLVDLPEAVIVAVRA